MPSAGHCSVQQVIGRNHCQYSWIKAPIFVKASNSAESTDYKGNDYSDEVIHFDGLAMRSNNES